MRRFGTSGGFLPLRLRPRRPRRMAAMACLVAGVVGAFVLDRAIRPRAAASPPPSGMNHAHLRESMISHAHTSGDAAPNGMISGMSRRLKVGSMAPDFSLPAVRGRGEVSLSDFRGRPVVLVFGSFSCIVFHDRIAEIERLHRTYKDWADFLFVSVTEAGHRIPGLEFVIDPPTTGGPDLLEERRRRVERAMNQTRMTLPGALDIEEAAEAPYDAYPTRLVAVGADGQIALDIGRGMSGQPWGLGEIEEWLKAQPAIAGGPGDRRPPPGPPRASPRLGRGQSQRRHAGAGAGRGGPA